MIHKRNKSSKVIRERRNRENRKWNSSSNSVWSNREYNISIIICSFTSFIHPRFLYFSINVFPHSSLFLHKYLCFSYLFIPFFTTSLLPHFGHFTSINAIFSPLFLFCFYLLYHFFFLFSTFSGHDPRP